MARKKSSRQKAVSSEPSVISDQKPYEVGVWSGMPLYKCRLCKFDTLKEDVIITHIDEHRLGKTTSPASTASPSGQTPLSAQREEGEAFEIELKEVDSTVDQDGNVHKTYTVKE